MGFAPRYPRMGGIMAARQARNPRHRGGFAEPVDGPEPVPEPVPVVKPSQDTMGYKPGTKPGMPPVPGPGIELPGVGVPEQKPQFYGSPKPAPIRPPEYGGPDEMVTGLPEPERSVNPGGGKRMPVKSRWRW